jgi:hypothetical protein
MKFRAAVEHGTEIQGKAALPTLSKSLPMQPRGHED